MNYNSAKYHKDPRTDEVCGIEIKDNGFKYSIPLDPANRHYAEIMRQVEAGELVIQEADAE